MRRIVAIMAVCAAVLMLGMQAARAQSEHKLAGSFSHAFTSEVMGDSFQIVVSLPFGYAQSEADFPLLLTLDGDVMFGMASEVPRLMSFERSAPPMVVASIVYGDFQRWLAGRQRDFHSKDGGAARFLTALAQEIVPFLQSQYRINEGDKALYGHSSGGLFAVFAAAHKPSLFQRILASSPSLEEELEWAGELLEQMTENPDKLPKIYISADKSETAMQTAIAPFDAMLSLGANTGRYRYDIIDQGGHMAVIPNAYGRGLRWLYEE